MARAGFWRHAIALAVDVLLLSLLVQLSALVLYPASGGHIQAEGSIGETACTASTAPPAGAVVSPDLRATKFTECRQTLYGIEHAHTLTVERVEQDGDGSTSVANSVLIGADGGIVAGLMLDTLILPVLVLVRALRDGRSRPTPGRWLTRTKVVGRTKGAAPGFGRALQRQLYYWLVPLLASGVFVGASLSGEIILPEFWPTVAFVFGVVFAWLAWIAASAIMEAMKRDTLADRLSGAVVVIEGTAEDAGGPVATTPP
ncbi:MAG: RDD family protein [Hyphomicrobiaceae bacterium]